jgi:hypothetical protein
VIKKEELSGKLFLPPRERERARERMYVKHLERKVFKLF